MRPNHKTHDCIVRQETGSNSTNLVQGGSIEPCHPANLPCRQKAGFPAVAQASSSLRHLQHDLANMGTCLHQRMRIRCLL